MGFLEKTQHVIWLFQKTVYILNIRQHEWGILEKASRYNQ
jgi:hypothetical protein